jgi:hypothetical protein
MVSMTGDAALWHDAEQRLRAELRRIDDVVDDLRAGTGDLRWQGPGAGRFRWRTGRRLRELADQRQLLVTAVSLARRAGDAAASAAPADADATKSGAGTGGAAAPASGGRRPA